MDVGPAADLGRCEAFDDARTAPGVVHDLGNLIQIAASAIALVSRRTPHDAGLEPTLARARIALSQAGVLVRQALAPPPAGSTLMRRVADDVDVSARLAEIAPLIRFVCQPDVQLDLDLPADLPGVRCNAVELQNVVLNLVINARDALPEGGRLEVSARPLAGGVELRVSDNGVGMPKDVLDRAFQPFFTTKSKERGSGLGLAMVRRFADDVGGVAMIESARGVGTTVRLTVPT